MNLVIATGNENCFVLSALEKIIIDCSDSCRSCWILDGMIEWAQGFTNIPPAIIPGKVIKCINWYSEGDMWHILKKIWPVFIGLAMYIAVSAYIQAHMDSIRPLLQERTFVYGMMLYVLVGIGTVIIPFTSLIPFTPVAVSLWGWRVTALLTLIAWVAGGQIAFEASRILGRKRITRFVHPVYMERIRKIISGKGIIRSVLVRMIIQGDIVSIGFGVFSHLGSVEFLAVTAIGVAPSAVLYAYFGSLSFLAQLKVASVAIALLTLYWFIDWRWPKLTKVLQMYLPA